MIGVRGGKGAVQLAVVAVEPGEKRPGQVYAQGGSVRVAEMCRDSAQRPGGSASAPSPFAAA